MVKDPQYAYLMSMKAPNSPGYTYVENAATAAFGPGFMQGTYANISIEVAEVSKTVPRDLGGNSGDGTGHDRGDPIWLQLDCHSLPCHSDLCKAG